jgi:hypothetical protein
MSDRRELSELRDDAAAWAQERARASFRDLAGLPAELDEHGPRGAVQRARDHQLATSRDALAQVSELLAAADPEEKPARVARLTGLRALLVEAVAEGHEPGAWDELRGLERRPLVELHGDPGLHGKLAPRAVLRDLGRERVRGVRADAEEALAQALGRFDGLRATTWETVQAALGELRLGEPHEAAARLFVQGWAAPVAAAPAAPLEEDLARAAEERAAAERDRAAGRRPVAKGPQGPPPAPGVAAPLALLHSRSVAPRLPTHAEQVAATCETLLQGTDAIASDLLAWLLERHTGARRAPGDAERHDLLHLLEAPRCSPAFPRGELLRTCRRWAEPLALDLHAGGRLKLDDDERPLKASGSHAVALDPPGEVRLSLLSDEGPRALGRLLGALSVGLLRASPPADAPAEDFFCGDPAVPVAAADLLGGLVRDDAFRRRVAKAELGPDDGRAIAIALLCDARLAAARALAELEAHREGLGSRAAALHRELHARAGLVSLPAGLALAGLDPLLGGWAELRGLAFAARARAALRERHDEDWWRNPRALLPLRSLWSRGGRPTLRELWSEVAPGEEPSVDALVRELTESCR